MNNFFLSCKECILEGPRSFYGCFYLGPFNSSQSLTVANALRRTLLSEISGLGIISVEIEGAKHEYSNFSGMRESILDLLLNFKEIVLYSNLKLKEKKCFHGYLQVAGPGIIRASDLKLPFGLFCVDPDQYIATLAENGKLNLKFIIGESKSSYSEKFSYREGLWNENFNNKSVGTYFNTNEFFLSDFEKSQSFGKIFKLDPVFTPIKKVNYSIEPYGTLTLDQNNQIIYVEIWTNGSIHPRNAIYEALSLLNNIFSNLEKMKILNDIYTKSILKSDQNYFKILKKTSSFLNLERTQRNSVPSNSTPLVYGGTELEETKNIASSNSKNQILDSKNIVGKQNFNLGIEEGFISKVINKNLNFNLKQYKNLETKRNSDSNSFKPSQLKVAKPYTGKSSLYDLDFLKFNSYTGNVSNVSTNFENLKIIYLKKKEDKIISKFASIKIFNLPFRIENSLIKANILTVNDLFTKNRNDLVKIVGIGNQSLYFLEKKISLFFTFFL